MNGNLPNLEFSYNWNNKLFCKYFTTFRTYIKDKYVIHGSYNIILLNGSNKYFFGDGTIISLKHDLIENFPEHDFVLDTGYSKVSSLKIIQQMYKNKNINFDKQHFCLLTIYNNSFSELIGVKNEIQKLIV